MIKNILIGLSIALGATALFFAFYNQETTVYVDTGKLFSEFKMSNELSKDLDVTLNKRKAIIDSLYEQVKALTLEVKYAPKKDDLKIKRLAEMEEELYYKQRQFEQDNQKNSEGYTSKVWAQLNQYLADFGQSHKYTYVWGATGQGNIMYASDKKNVTEELIQYVNDRYDDKIKK